MDEPLTIIESPGGYGSGRTRSRSVKVCSHRRTQIPLRDAGLTMEQTRTAKTPTHDQLLTLSEAGISTAIDRIVTGLVTVAQASNYLRTGERFVRRLIAERRISHLKLGNTSGCNGQCWTPSLRAAGRPAS